MVRSPRFEPGSSASQADVLDQTRLRPPFHICYWTTTFDDILALSRVDFVRLCFYLSLFGCVISLPPNRLAFYRNIGDFVPSLASCQPAANALSSALLV